MSLLLFGLYISYLDVFKHIIYYCEFQLVINDEDSSEIDNKNELDKKHSMEVQVNYTSLR